MNNLFLFKFLSFAWILSLFSLAQSQGVFCPSGEEPIKISMPWGDKLKCSDGSDPTKRNNDELKKELTQESIKKVNVRINNNNFEKFMTFFVMYIFNMEGSDELEKELGINLKGCSIGYTHRAKSFSNIEIFEKKFSRFNIRYEFTNENCPLEKMSFMIGYPHHFYEMIRHQNNRFFCGISFLDNNANFKKILPLYGPQKNKTHGCIIKEMKSDKVDLLKFKFEFENIHIILKRQSKLYSGYFVFEVDLKNQKIELVNSKFNLIKF